MVRAGNVSGLLVLACIALTGFGNSLAVAAEDEDEPLPEARAAASIRVEYEPEITGVKDSDLRERLEAAAQLFALADHPPATVAGLERRAREDVDRLQATLRSEGYYAAVIDFALDAAPRPVAVRIQVKPGPRYRLRVFAIHYTGAADPEPAHRPTLKDIGKSVV